MADIQKAADWSALYSDRALRSLEIPGFSRMDPAEGLFRHMLLVLDDLPVGRKGNEAAPFDVICCDVLLIGDEVTLTRDTYIFARRIELSGKARLQLDRTNGQFGLWVVAQEIVDRATGAAGKLPLCAIWLDDAGDPHEADDSLWAASNRPAIALILPAGETVLAPAHPNQVAQVFMRRGEELPLCLNTQFLYAALVFVQHPRLAAQILSWVAALVQASSEFADLSAEAKVLRETVVNLSRNKGATLVPTLDHSVYAESAQQCLTLLQQRQERFRQLMSMTKQDRNWREDAATALADRRNEAELYASLEKQAQTTRDQAEQARWLATVRINDDNIELVRKQHAFETGILDWKRKQTQSAIVDIVTNAVMLLIELPKLVAAAPAAASAVTDLIGGAVEIAGSSAKGDFNPLPSNLPKWAKQAKENAEKTGSLDDLSMGKQGSPPAREENPKSDDAPKPDDPAPETTTTTTTGKEGSDGKPPETMDPEHKPPGADTPHIPIIGGEADSKPSDKDDDLVMAPFGRDGASDRETKSSPTVADVIDKNITATENPEAKAWARQAKERAKAEKEAKAKREEQKAAFVKSFQSAAGNTKAIVQAAMRISQIAETAEDMEHSGNELLTEIQAGLTVALSGIDLKGLGAVTGGSEEWDKMALSIDAMFETLADGELLGVAGAKPYRECYRRLLIDGKAMSQARLALAKANADLAAAKIRRLAADRAVALFQQRARDLDDAVLRDELYQQAAFQRVVEAKRGVFLALEAYRRAFAYFTLQPPDRLPVLPRITDSIDAMSSAVRSIAGHKLASETISALYGPPSTLNGVELVVNDPDTLARLREPGGVVTVSIPVTNPAFAAFRRVRLGGVRVYLDGVEQGAKLTIRIENNGVYNDKALAKQTGSGQSYVTRPERKVFVYQQGRDAPIADADIAQRYANDFFRPTPFTTWRFQLARDAGPVPDLAGVHAIRLCFFGEYSS